MKNKLILLLVIISCQSIGFCKNNDYTIIKDTTAFQQDLADFSKKIQTIDTAFVQEKYLDVLSDKVKSFGKLYYKKEDKIRWEYNKPFSYIIVINEDMINIKTGDVVERYKTNSNKIFYEMNKLILQMVKGDILTNNDDFLMKFMENNLDYVIELKPKDKNMKEYLQVIKITINKKDFSMSAIQIFENASDYTKIKFYDKKVNMEINDEIFILN